MPETVKYIEVLKTIPRPDKFDVWGSAPKAEWQYVDIPLKDMHGYSYPPISINQDIFDEKHNSFVSATKDADGDGFNKFFVPPMLADELQRVMKRANAEMLRLLDPRRRKQVVKQFGLSMPE